MSASLHLFKARILLLCSLGVVLIGLAPLAYAIGVLAWQLHMYRETGILIGLPASLVFKNHALACIPHLDWAWSSHEVVRQIASNVHIGVIPGLIGCAMLAVGISSLLRQRLLIRIHKERRKALASPVDPGYEGRREPVIGTTDVAPAPANDTPAPQPAPQTTATGPVRLVAERNSRTCRQTRGRPIRRRAAA